MMPAAPSAPSAASAPSTPSMPSTPSAPSAPSTASASSSKAASPLPENIARTRRAAGLTQEELAAQVGVSRQTVSDWERGDATPDLSNAARIAQVLGVTVDSLVSFDSRESGLPVPPRGKHIFGTVTVGERGQVVIPKAARDLFGIGAGDSLVVLGDEDQGLAIMKADSFLAGVENLRKMVEGASRTAGADEQAQDL